MMRFKPIPVLVLAFALAVGCAGLVPLPPAASIGIGVAPSLLELSATPGGTGKQALQVSNVGDQPVDATVAVIDLPDATAAHSAARWLTVSPATVHLGPKQKQTIDIAIAVPRGLVSGGYYAAVTITTGAGKPGTQSVGVAGQLAVPFLFTVKAKGEVKEAASIARFAPVLEPDGRLGFQALVRSSGNVYVKVNGSVEIATADGKHYASLKIPDSGRILPGTEQVLRAQGSVPVQQGASYKASVMLHYGKSHKQLTASATFTMQIPPLALADMGVCENLDTGPTLAFGLANGGTLAVQPAVTLTVKHASGGEVGSATMPGALAWPQDTTTFGTTYGEQLESGTYVFVVSAHLGNLAPVTKELPFQIGGIGGHPVPVCPTPPASQTG